jgi:hypothetical protein
LIKSSVAAACWLLQPQKRHKERIRPNARRNTRTAP